MPSSRQRRGRTEAAMTGSKMRNSSHIASPGRYLSRLARTPARNRPSSHSCPRGHELPPRATGLPAAHDHPLLRVEGDALLALDVQVAEEAALGAGEREHGHRRGHADIDADHAGAGAVLELAGGVAAARVDDRAVA